MFSIHHPSRLTYLTAMGALLLIGCGEDSTEQKSAETAGTAAPNVAVTSPAQPTAPAQPPAPTMRKASQEDPATTQYLSLLRSPDYQAQAGNVLARMKVNTAAELRQALNQPPREALSVIVNRRTLYHLRQPDIGKKHNVIPFDDIPHVVRKRNPMLKKRDRVTLPTVKGRMVSGMIVDLSSTVVKVGSVFINRDDLPFALRAKIWPEDNQALIEKSIRDQYSRTRWAVEKFVKPRLAKELPDLFFQAGYLPDPTRTDASLANPNPECWIPRTQILAALQRQQTKAAEAEDTED